MTWLHCSKLIIITNFLSISNEKGHFDYQPLSQDFEWKNQLKFLVCQVWTKQLLKKVFPIYLMTLSYKAIATLKTRMHSSRMRTVLCSGHLMGGGGSAWGDLPGVGVSAWGGSTWGGGLPGGLHPSPGQNSWHMLVKTLPSRNSVCER